MPKNYWMGFKTTKFSGSGRPIGKRHSHSPDTYHKVRARSRDEAVGIFLKGTHYVVGEVVVRRSPPRGQGWQVGKHFAHKPLRRR